MKNNKSDAIKKSKKPLWKRWYLWLVVLTIIGGISSAYNKKPFNYDSFLKQNGFVEKEMVTRKGEVVEYEGEKLYTLPSANFRLDASAYNGFKNLKLDFKFYNYPNRLKVKYNHIKDEASRTNSDAQASFLWQQKVDYAQENLSWYLNQLESISWLKGAINGNSGKRCYNDLTNEIQGRIDSYSTFPKNIKQAQYSDYTRELAKVSAFTYQICGKKYIISIDIGLPDCDEIEIVIIN